MSKLPKLSKPHDALFKASMSDIATAKAFFMQHLPSAIQVQLDLDSLQPCATTFISPQFREQQTDLLFKVNLKASEEFAYLYFHMEHQSTSQQDMAWRMLEYVMEIIRKHKQQTKAKILPLVIPVVVYAGKEPYTAPTDIYELFPKEQQALARQVMFHRYHLINFMTMPDDELVQDAKIGLLQLTMKYAHLRNFMQHWRQWTTVLARYIDSLENLTTQDQDYLMMVAYYLMTETDIQDDEQAKFFAILRENLPTVEGNIMTLAQRLEQKGYEAGIEKGIERGIEKGIEKGKLEGQHALLIEFLKCKFGATAQQYTFRIHQAHEDQLITWTKKAANAQTLGDIFNESN